MKKVLELIEQIRFAELEKIANLSKAQEAFLDSSHKNNQNTSS